MAVDRLYRTEIQIPAAQVGSGGVSNYTIVLNQSSFITNCSAIIDADGSQRAQLDGGDLIATSDEAGNSRLALHVVRWSLNNNPALSDVLLNVGTVNLSSAALNKIYLWWGHASAQSQPAAGAAFGQHATYHSSLKAYWGMDEGSGITANDYTSNARHGTLTDGPTWEAGTLGNGIGFDGTNDAVTTGVAASNFITQTAGSMVCWLKPTGSAPVLGSIYMGGFLGDSGAFFSLIRGVSGGLDKIWAYNFDGSEDYVSVAYTVDQWAHFAWVHDSGTLRLYKNGVDVGSVASGNTSSVGNLLRMGGMAAGYSFLTGQLDDVRVYNVGLSAADLSTVYNNTSAPGTFAVAQALVETAVKVTPSPLVATWSIPPISTKLVNKPNPLALICSTVAPATIIRRSVLPVTATWSLPWVATVFRVKPSPLVATWSIPTPELMVPPTIAGMEFRMLRNRLHYRFNE